RPFHELGGPHHFRRDVARRFAEIVFRVVVRTKEDQVVGAVVEGIGDRLDVGDLAVILIPADRAAVMGPALMSFLMASGMRGRCPVVYCQGSLSEFCRKAVRLDRRVPARLLLKFSAGVFRSAWGISFVKYSSSSILMPSAIAASILVINIDHRPSRVICRKDVG